MAMETGEPRVFERGPYQVVRVYACCRGDEEPWGEASEGLARRTGEIRDRVGDTLLGFLYRPHRDDPGVPEDVRACFMGVEVSNLEHVPEGMSATHFPGGEYVVVECRGDTENEAAMAVGPAIGQLGSVWLRENGCVMGDACFTCSHEHEPKPPFVEYVHMKIERPA
jgi:hypothetical protein